MSRSSRLADIWPSQVRLAQPGPPEYLLAEFRQGLLGALGLAEAHQGMQQQCPPGMKSTCGADHFVACECGLAPQYRYSTDLGDWRRNPG